MKILFLSAWFPTPPDNGAKIRVYHLLQALASRHQVSVISFAFGTADPAFPSDLYALCSSLQVIRCDPFARKPVARALRFLSPAPILTAPLPAMTRLVKSVLAQTDFEAVIASTEVMATYALSASSPIKILEEHNSLTRWMEERYHHQTARIQRLRCWLSWQKTRRYEANLFSKFALCTMVSPQDRDTSQHQLPGYRGRVEVVPNGVDCCHNQPGLAQPAPNTLIFNGALTYYANYDAIRYFLAEVYPLIRQQIPAVSLTITGSTQNVNLSGLKLTDSVHFSGYVNDIRPLVAGHWVCIAPIRCGGGTRLKILEAMALGTPVVATAKAAEGLTVTHADHLLLADTPQTFAGQVIRLLRYPELRQSLARRARRLVEQQYDWHHIGQNFVNLIDEVADCRQSGGIPVKQYPVRQII